MAAYWATSVYLVRIHICCLELFRCDWEIVVMPERGQDDKVTRHTR